MSVIHIVNALFWLSRRRVCIIYRIIIVYFRNLAFQKSPSLKTNGRIVGLKFRMHVKLDVMHAVNKTGVQQQRGKKTTIDFQISDEWMMMMWLWMSGRDTHIAY